MDYGPAFLASRKVAEPIINQIVQVSGGTVIFSTNAQVQQDQLSVGNISNATGIAIGKEAKAEVTEKNPAEGI